jgi:hypothetical protein
MLRAVVVDSLSRIDGAIRACWSPETCDPVDIDDWSEANPARGQCVATALVVQDHLGGELLIAEVRHANGARQGVHYWNRLASGLEVDLTRDQFKRGEVVGSAEVAARPKDVTRGRLAEQYRLLSDAVASRLLG